MALPLTVEKIDAVEEPFRNLYVEKDGVYYLQVDGLPDTSPLEESIKKLEAKNKELTEERKAEAKKRKEQEDAAQDAIAEAAKKSGDVEALEKSWQAKFDAREKELLDQLDVEQSCISRLTVDHTATSIAAEIGKDKFAQELLLPHIKKRLRTDRKDGEATTIVVDDEGKPSAMNVVELIESFRTDPRNASLVMGTNANGPGSTFSSGSDASGKKFSDYNGEERVALKKSNPDEYRRLRDAGSA